MIERIKIDLEEQERELCPNCGKFVSVLDLTTGWCRRCVYEVKKGWLPEPKDRTTDMESWEIINWEIIHGSLPEGYYRRSCWKCGAPILTRMKPTWRGMNREGKPNGSGKRTCSKCISESRRAGAQAVHARLRITGYSKRKK